MSSRGPRIIIEGAERLPSDIDAGRFARAAQTVGRWLGLRGDVTLTVSGRRSGRMGEATADDDDGQQVVLYVKGIRAMADHEEHRTLTWEYATTLVHELVHLSQERRRCADLPWRIGEAEAYALEGVYGPEAERILRGGD